VQGNDFEYRGLMASTWDLLRGDTSRWEDRFAYLKMIEKYGQPALDVGCATGRLLLDYLQNGIDIDGVDISPEMLALCTEKASKMGLSPVLYQQAMENLELPRRYRTILVPSSSFQLILDPDQAAQAMLRLHAHLQPKGALVMPFMRLWREGDPLESDWELMSEKVRPEDGAMVRKWSRWRYDPQAQLEYTEDRYEVMLDGVVLASEHHRRSPVTREYTKSQAVQLYHLAGFAEIRLLSGFSMDPARDEDRIFSVVGEKG